MPDQPEYINTDIATAFGFAHDSESKLDRYRPFCMDMHLILADQLAHIPDIYERLRLHTQAIQNAWHLIKLTKSCPFEPHCPKAPPRRPVQLLLPLQQGE
jgi:hypothetical protein